MGLLDAYQEGTDTALSVMASRPLEPEPVKQKHSAWSVVPRALAAGAAEIGGNIIDSASAFGQVAAASGGLTPGFDPDQQKNRAASVEAMDKLKTEGIDWRTEESQTQYAFSRDLRPDPMTAGTAENLVFGLTRGLTKAVGAGAILGPFGGAAAFGTSEGLTDADALAAQGVDLATRTKVGAVSAAMNAAGVALPVAGKTLAQTAGLVAVGGPLSFMTQQQATRSILEAADYHDIAKQYDPLDPVGLTVATLVPAGFAAAARAGARGAAKPLETGTKAPEIVPTRDDIDAAMVHNLTTLRDVHEAVAADIAARPVDETPPTVRSEADQTVANQQSPQPAKVADEVTSDAYRARVEQLATEQPDLVARLDDAGQPVRLADELEAVRKAAQEGTETEFGALDAPLLQVAAECALATGTAAL
jgi:hypothetical protein